jgi:hypothetical protein
MDYEPGASDAGAAVSYSVKARPVAPSRWVFTAPLLAPPWFMPTPLVTPRVPSSVDFSRMRFDLRLVGRRRRFQEKGLHQRRRRLRIGRLQYLNCMM